MMTLPTLESKSDKKYIGVNVPREWEKYLKEALEKPQIQKELEFNKFRKTFSGLGCWVIRKFLIEETSFRSQQILPRLQQINCDENGVKIWDQALHKLVEVFFKPTGILCNICNVNDCLHIQFALTQPNIKEQIRKRRKEGWKLPEV